MTGELAGLVPSVASLAALAAVAAYWTAGRRWVDVAAGRTRGARVVAALAVLGQAVHFGEELATGFHERFPALFGLPAMPVSVFVAFNVAWLVVWAVCVGGLGARRRGVLFALGFLAIASVANAVAHPALALLADGYFPGLWTSPVSGVLGVLLLGRLSALTRPAA